MLIVAVNLLQMEKEIRDLKKQRDGAQSRVEELLKLVENDQDPKPLVPVNSFVLEF